MSRQGKGKIYEEGHKFGLLTLIREIPEGTYSPAGQKLRLLELECHCGKVIQRALASIGNSEHSTCGCSRPSRIRDLKGSVFGELTVLEFEDKRNGNGSVYWTCQCSCGNIVSMASNALLYRGRHHCGCLNVKAKKTKVKDKTISPKRIKHGMVGTPTYRSWGKMLARVRNEEYADFYADVTVCDRWDTYKGGSFENFLEDMGERPEGKTLNRIGSAKVYSKETCEWADLGMQSFDTKRKATNSSGRTGVRWREDRQVWEAKIGVDNGHKIVYYGKSFEEAVKAREEAELKYYGFIKE